MYKRLAWATALPYWETQPKTISKIPWGRCVQGAVIYWNADLGPTLFIHMYINTYIYIYIYRNVLFWMSLQVCKYKYIYIYIQANSYVLISSCCLNNRLPHVLDFIPKPFQFQNFFFGTMTTHNVVNVYNYVSVVSCSYLAGRGIHVPPPGRSPPPPLPPPVSWRWIRIYREKMWKIWQGSKHKASVYTVYT